MEIFTRHYLKNGTFDNVLCKAFIASDIYKVVAYDPDYKGGYTNIDVEYIEDVTIKHLYSQRYSLLTNDIIIMKRNHAEWFSSYDDFSGVPNTINKITIEGNQITLFYGYYRCKINIEDGSENEMMECLFEALKFAHPDKTFTFENNTIELVKTEENTLDLS